MWMFLMMVCLLDQNQAAPLPWEHSSLQLILQQQLDQTAPPPTPDVGQQKTSSSSSSSSSASSESSQSSEGPQQLRERQKLENMAVEQLDSSQESPSNSSTLWLNELVLLEERAGERDGERHTGDDSEDSRKGRRQALLLSFHRLLSQPGLTAVTSLGGAIAEAITLTGRGITVVGKAITEGGATGEKKVEVTQLPDDSTERTDGLMLDSPDYSQHHGYHGNEPGLELGL